MEEILLGLQLIHCTVHHRVDVLSEIDFIADDKLEVVTQAAADLFELVIDSGYL